MAGKGGDGIMKFGRNSGHEIRRPDDNPGDISPLAVMKREMRPGEKLIWADRPVDIGAFRRAKYGVALFGVPFLAFALFWTAAASGLLFGDGGTGSAFDLIFPMFGLPFIAVGLSLVFSPIWAGFKGRRTLYALSDQRALMTETGVRRSVKSWPLDEIDEVSRTDTSGGNGDVIFAKTWVRGSKGGGHWQKHGFYGISDPQRVEHAILQAREAIRLARNAQSAANDR